MNPDSSGQQESSAEDLRFVGTHKHICCFYRTVAEMEQIWVPFIIEGIKQRQKAMVVVGDDYSIDEAFDALADAGLDAARYFKDGALVIVNNDGFPTSAQIEPKEVIEFWNKRLEAACNEGYESVRVVAQMTWLTDEQREADFVPQYEFLGNRLFPGLPVSALCLYDREIFSRYQLDRVAAVHPFCADAHSTTSPTTQNVQAIGAREFLVQRAVASSSTHASASGNADAYHSAAQLLRDERFDQAEPLFRQAIELEQGLPKVTAMLGLVQCLRAQSRIAEAERVEEQATNLLLKRA